MQVSFNPSLEIDRVLRETALSVPSIGPDFDPGVRPADPRFGDFQANGVLGYAKRKGINPRELGEALLHALQASDKLDPKQIEMTLSGPGFLNFRLSGDRGGEHKH